MESCVGEIGNDAKCDHGRIGTRCEAVGVCGVDLASPTPPRRLAPNHAEWNHGPTFVESRDVNPPDHAYFQPNIRS